MLLFYYNVPEENLSEVNNRLFELGLGKFEHYDCCCWVTKGRGQFRPLEGSKPYIGHRNRIEYIDEYKVEMICPDELKEEAIRVLLEAHPYETPAYGFLLMQ